MTWLSYKRKFNFHSISNYFCEIFRVLRELWFYKHQVFKCMFTINGFVLKNSPATTIVKKSEFLDKSLKKGDMFLAMNNTFAISEDDIFSWNISSFLSISCCKTIKNQNKLKLNLTFIDWECVFCLFNLSFLRKWTIFHVPANATFCVTRNLVKERCCNLYADR